MKVSLYLREEKSKPEYPKKNPDNQSGNEYHVIRGEISPPKTPASSDIGDKFALSERAIRFYPIELLAVADTMSIYTHFKKK